MSSLSPIASIPIPVATDGVSMVNHIAELNAVEAAFKALGTLKGTNSAGTDAYVLTLPGVTAYTDSLLVLMRTSVANTGAASLNINGLGAKPIRTFKAGVDADISTGEIPANSQVLLCYSSTAVSGAGGFVSLNIRDADLLDGLHSSAFATAAQGTLAANALPASSYTATDVLAKILSGGDIRLKLVSGIPHYSTDGSVWNPVGLICTKPRVWNIRQSVATQNTWYSLGSATGKGRLNEVIVTTLNGVTNNNFEIEITIDGVPQVISNSGVESGSNTPGGAFNEAKATERHVGPVEFLSSMSIRVRHVYAANLDLHATAHLVLA